MSKPTTPLPPGLALDPALSSAINRWLDTTQQTLDDVNTAQAGINPLQSLLQSSARTTDFLSSLDWFGIFQKPQKADVYQQIFQEFNELVTAATQRISNDQETLLDTMVADARAVVADAGAVMSKPASVDNPQALLADLINKSLDAYDNAQEQMRNQLQTYMSIQSAYLAWYQQSLASIAVSKDTSTRTF